MGLLKFYCDESYDSQPTKQEMVFYPERGRDYKPKAYVVGGFLANELIWGEIEKRWREENKRVGVKRFHGVYVNARTGEFEGWSKDQQIEYSKHLLAIMSDQKRELHAISCGMFPREYEEIIDQQGREKLGHPYIACFKSCVTMIANEMETRKQFEPDDQFAIILDRNDWELEAVEVFYKLKDTTIWPPHRRLATCTPGGWEEHLALQPADLIAYETFRILCEKYEGREKFRPVLRSMFGTNGFLGYYFESETFKRLKEPIANSDCIRNGFVITLPQPPDEESTDE